MKLVQCVRLAFVGTHSAGKTTAAHHALSWLKTHGYPRAEMLPEVARLCSRPIGAHSDFETEVMLIGEQMRLEERLASQADVLVCDRSMHDHEVYARWLMNEGHLLPAEWQFVNLVSTAWARVRPYHALLRIVPTEFVPDLARGEDPKWQADVDGMWSLRWGQLMRVRGGAGMFLLRPRDRAELLPMVEAVVGRVVQDAGVAIDTRSMRIASIKYRLRRMFHGKQG